MSWKEKALERVRRTTREEVKTHMGFVRGAKMAGKVAETIIEVSDIPLEPYIEAIGAEVNIYDAENKLVHHLAKKLHITFKKYFSHKYGTLSYATEIDGVKVRIANIKDPPKCKIIAKKRKETVEVTTYELVCK